MYGQGNYAPQFRQGTQTPRPPFQRPLTPHFQSGPLSVTPQVDYSSSFQYQHPPPLPGQHGPPVRLPTTGVPNAPQPYHLPPRPSQVHASNSALHSYPTAQHNTHRAQNIQHTPLPLPGPHHQEMFQPPVPYRVSTYAPHPSSMRSTSQLPPPLPTSNFFPPAPVFAMGPTPPPLPPSSPPPVPPFPPPTIPPPSFGALTSTTLDAACESPHILKSVSTSIVFASEMLGSDSADKVAPTTENMVDTNTADDNKHLTGRTSAVVGSPASGNSSSEERAELDLLPPPPKPGEENVVQKIEVLCRFIAKNGPGFEYMTRQKESANPEFRFLFGGEPGSEVAVAHEYFKWVKKKCLLQHSQSNSAVELSEMLSSVQTNPMDTDVSPSVSDMEMEDDFTKPADIHCETVFIPEEHDNREQLCGPQNFLGSNSSRDIVSTFSQLAEEEKGIGFGLSLQNDQPTCGIAFSVVDSLNASPSGAAKLAENSFIGVSSSSPFEDINSTGKPPGEPIKDASPIRLLQGYVFDDSSEHDDKPSLGDAVPMAVPPSNTACDTSLRGDMQSNILTDQGLKILSNAELAFGKSFESGEEHSRPSSPSNDQEPLPKSQRAAEEASTGTVQAEELAVSPEAFRGKDVLDVVHEVAPEERKHQVEDVQRTSILRNVDEFGRLVRDVSSDSDPDELRRANKHGKRGRSRSRSPHDRRSRRSPRRRREKRSWSRSWSPKKRRSRSRSPFHRRGIESGRERVRKDKGRLPDCLDFLRGRCHRGASCRYMHHENDKSVGARYNMSTRISDRREEVENFPYRRSVYEHDLRGSSSGFVEKKTPNRKELLYPAQGFVQTIVSNHDDKILVADVCKSEKSTATVLESSDMKEEILESTHKLLDFENRERNVESDHAVDRSSSRLINDGFSVSSVVDYSRGIASSTEELVTEKSQAKNRIEISEPELIKNASSIFNQGAHFEPPAPPPPVSHGTCVPPPLLPKERVQPPINYPYQGHFQMQQPCYPTPPNTWPPPPPPLLQPQFAKNFSAATAIQGVPPPFQQNQFPPRNDYRMFQHHSYPAPSSQIEDKRSKPLSMDNTVSQTYESHLSSFSLPSLGHSTISGLRFGNYGNINAPFEGSKIALHYNPYASTFDQPFDSKFNSNVLNHGKDLPCANPYGASHSLSHTPVDTQVVISPPKTAQAAELRKSGNDQYDPLFDSIEPSSNSFKKLDQSESTLRLSSSRKALDVGENSKQKEVEAAAISMSIKSNEEFGETADAEVGEVESERSSNPLDGGHAAMGEVEIDQEKTPENGKNSKDSRSMKLFKSSLAEYVKEVLKPHWRQGGMSKEAFKIIVKKTIDKVSGAMKSHHIPKSQEKISKYIDSSERKLNKLVMGYVDKYAKI